MSKHASWVLARGWWRGMRGWWMATVLVLAIVQVLLMSVAAVFAGMEAETDRRIRDFYTGDARVTLDRPGAAPDAYWLGDNVTAAREMLQGDGMAAPRLESQFVLSRRTLVEAYLEEDEQYRVRTPGGTPGDTDFYGLGLIIGLDTQADGADPIREYLLPGGRMPRADGRSVELLMSADAFRDYAGPDAESFPTWPPATATLETIRFEITTARIDPDSSIKDLIRYPARVVGLFETGLDAVDTFTVVAERSAVQRLLGYDADDNVANAFALYGGDPDPAHEQGWAVEGPQSFAQRYIGQLIAVVQSLALTLSLLFVALPLFLVWHGLSQLLEMHHREYAVCRAIGIPSRVLALGILILVGMLVLAAAGITALLVVSLPAVMDPLLQDTLDLPLPVRYVVTPASIWLAMGTAIIAMGIAVVAALRRLTRAELATELRA